MRFKFLEHTADVKFQAFGKTMEEAFVNSALALKEVICGKLKIKQVKIKKIKVKGRNNGQLLLNFLEEFLFLLDSQNFLLSKIKKIKITYGKLEAEVLGDRAKNYDLIGSVKAITYNQMFVKKEGKRFIIQVVLDV